MPYEIIINRELCESNAECVAMAPAVFALDDEDFCVDAARTCPVDAITLIDHYGAQAWP
jgi:ferredoxin